MKVALCMCVFFHVPGLLMAKRRNKVCIYFNSAKIYKKIEKNKFLRHYF